MKRFIEVNPALQIPCTNKLNEEDEDFNINCIDFAEQLEIEETFEWGSDGNQDWLQPYLTSILNAYCKKHRK